MTPVRHLIIAAMHASLVVIAMIDRTAGAGVLGGIVVSAVVSAVRDYRRQKKHEAESAVLDQQLSSALASARAAAARFERAVASADEEQRWS